MKAEETKQVHVRRFISKLLVSVLVVFLCIAGIFMSTNANSGSKQLNVVFTHDIHSHLDSFTTLFNGSEISIGGFARIKTIIEGEKEKNPDTLVVDGGDFSMGTLYQTVYEEEAAELRMLGFLGYDVVTIGNHEFDYRSKGLNQMLETAVASGDVLPKFVLCNVDFTNPNEGAALIKKGFDDYGVTDYVVLQKGDVKIAVTGVFGKDSLSCAPTCELTFTDPVTSVKETVAKIQANENVDMIVCLSHSGTNDNADKSEDEILAKAVPELDLIISGHSHTTLEKPIQYGDTYIVSSGEYGMEVGTLFMEQKEGGRWSVSAYDLIPVTDEIVSDEDTLKKIAAFGENVDTDYLSKFGYTSNQVVAKNPYDFCAVEDVYDIHEEHTLGDIIADSYRYGVNKTGNYDPVDVAAVPSGTIRDTYTKGDVTVKEIFNSYSLGIGPDEVPGYPLISIYLNGSELKTLAEVDASVSDLMTTARLYFSGLNFTYNPHRMILNKVTDIYLTGDDGKKIPVENDKLYHVVADLYSGQMLSTVTDMSYGILSVVPKNADGSVVENFEDCIVYNGNREVKAWESIAEYMGSFKENEEGVSVIPEIYSANQGRKVVDNSKNIGALVSHPNKYAVMIVVVVLIIAAVLILMVLLFVKLIRQLSKKIRKN